MCPRRLLLLLVLVAETHSKPPSHVLSEMAASHGHSLACQQMKWMANNTPQVLLHERHNSFPLLPFSAAAVEAERRPTLPQNHNSLAFILGPRKRVREETDMLRAERIPPTSGGRARTSNRLTRLHNKSRHDNRHQQQRVSNS